MNLEASQYTITHIDLILRRLDSFTHLVATIGAIGLPLEGVDLNQLAWAEAYRTNIQQLADLMEARGILVETRGRLGEVVSEGGVLARIEAGFQSLRAAAEQIGDPELINLVLRTESLEADFVAVAQLRTCLQIAELWDAFRIRFQEVDPEIYRARAIQTLVDDYQDNLAIYADLDQQVDRISFDVGFTNISNLLGDLQDIAQEQVAQAKAAVNAHAALVLRTITWAVIVAFGLEGFLATSIQRGIARSLARVLQTTRQIAGGDLSRRVAIPTKTRSTSWAASSTAWPITCKNCWTPNNPHASRWSRSLRRCGFHPEDGPGRGRPPDGRSRCTLEMPGGRQRRTDARSSFIQRPCVTRAARRPRRAGRGCTPLK